MLLSEEIFQILREESTVNLEDLAVKTEQSKENISHFIKYVGSLVDDNLIKYDGKTGEYSL